MVQPRPKSPRKARRAARRPLRADAVTEALKERIAALTRQIEARRAAEAQEDPETAGGDHSPRFSRSRYAAELAT